MFQQQWFQSLIRVPSAYAVHIFKSQFDPHENSLNSARFVELGDTVLLMRQEVGLQ